MEPQALLIERAMRAFDKPILWWVMRIANTHSYSQGVTKAYEGGGKVTALSEIPPKPSVPVQSDRGR